jgi:hypothetical protein
VQARGALAKAHADDRGILCTREGCLDIRASKGNLERAIRIMAGFIELTEAEGFSITVGGGHREETTAVLLGQRVKFGLTEKIERVDASGVALGTALDRVLTYGGKPVTYKPTGEFFFEAYGVWDVHKKWKEGKAGPMEETLPTVLAGLIRIALPRRAEELRQAELEREKRRRALELEQLKTAIKTEQSKIDDLRRLAADWNRAERLRAFIEAARIPEWSTANQ